MQNCTFSLLFWSALLRMRMLENRVLRGIFEPERDEVTGRWKK